MIKRHPNNHILSKNYEVNTKNLLNQSSSDEYKLINLPRSNQNYPNCRCRIHITVYNKKNHTM